MAQTHRLEKPTKRPRPDVTPTQRTAVILMSQLLVLVALLVLRSVIKHRREQLHSS